MGEIVLHGQKFKITGNEPTPQEQLAIDSYLDYREQSSGKTGNKELDDQAILTLKPEDVLSEANKGKYNKDTENFINSPSFKRIVLEVGLSIVGGVAGAALAPVTGGASLAASAALAARVARLARPLLNISANTVSRIGVGTAGGAVGGATGAALAQKFDPKEDIVREITRGALQGGLGELAGFGLAGGLSKIYNKISKAKVNELYGASRALNVLDREKKFFGELLKIKNVGQLTAKEIEDLVTNKTFTKQQISILKNPAEARKIIDKLENKHGTDFLVKKVPISAITPGIAIENSAVDLLEGMAKSSFFGGPLIRAQGAATNTLAESMDIFGNAIIKASSKEGLDPNGFMIGKIIQDNLTRNQETFKIAKTSMFRELAEDSKKYLYTSEKLADGSIVRTPIESYKINIGSRDKIKIFNPQMGKIEETTSLKEFAKDELVKLRGDKVTRDFGPKLPNKAAEDFLTRLAGLPDNLTFAQVEDIYRNGLREFMPGDQLHLRLKGEFVKRMTNYLATAPLPAQLNGVRQTIVNFAKMGDEVFEQKIMKSILESPRGQEKVYDQIVLANNESVTKHFLNLIDTKVTVPGVKKGTTITRPLFDNPEEIKMGIRGQFFKNFLENSKGIDGPYEVLKPNQAFKFLEDYDAFIKKSGLITKEQAKNLEDYVTALRFSEGKITRPGVSGKAATVFIQLKQAGAITQLGTIGVLGGTGNLDIGTFGTILLAPAVVARMFANPQATRLLIEGVKLQPRTFGQYEKYMTQLTSGLVGQGFIGADQARLVNKEIKANEDVLTDFFNGKAPVSANSLPERISDAPALNLNEEETQQRLNSTRQSPPLPNITPSNFGAQQLSPQARGALASGDIYQAIAAQGAQPQMPQQFNEGGIASVKR